MENEICAAACFLKITKIFTFCPVTERKIFRSELEILRIHIVLTFFFPLSTLSS